MKCVKVHYKKNKKKQQATFDAIGRWLPVDGGRGRGTEWGVACNKHVSHVTHTMMTVSLFVMAVVKCQDVERHSRSE